MFYQWAMIDEELKSELNKMVFMPLTAISISIWVAFGLCCKLTNSYVASVWLLKSGLYTGLISLLTGLIAINRCMKLYQLYHRDEMKVPLLEQINT